MIPPLPTVDESRRFEAIQRYQVLDSLPEPVLDDLTALAAKICGTPIALISVVAEERQWFKSKVGLAASELPRSVSFCGHTILQRDLFIVPDAKRDVRFADNPLVTGEPGIGFYAGAPLVTPDGHAVGTICVIDRTPRELTPLQQETLRVLSRQVMAQLELRRQTRELRESEERLFRVFRTCPVGLAINRASDSTFTDANAAFTTITGWSRDEAMGRTAIELGIVSEAEAARVRSNLSASHTMPGIVLTIATRSSEIREVLMSAERVELRGEPHVVSTFVDLTAHKRAQENLALQAETLSAVTASLAAYVERGDWRQAMGSLLRCAMTQTGSEYGFIGVVVGSTLRVLAHEGMAWDAVLNRDFYEQEMRRYEELGYLEFTSFDNLFGRAITTGKVVIANQPAVDPRAKGRPAGHPPMHSFLGVPIFAGEQVQGVVALANRMDGYSGEEQSRIETLVQHAGGLCTSYRQREAAVGMEADRRKAERAMHESVERFQAVARATDDAVYDWNLETNALWWNENFCALFGYAADEIDPGIESWASRLHPDDAERVQRGMDAVIQGGGQSWSDEYRFRRRDGSYAEVHDRGHVLRDEAGRGLRMVGAMQDITGRKQAELRLRQLNRTHAVLSDINQLIMRHREPQAILDGACHVAVKKGGFLLAWLGLVRAAAPLELKAHAGATPDTVALLQRLLGDPEQGCAFTLQAVESGGHAVCNDIARDPRAQAWREAALQRGYRSMAALPLTMAGRVVGAFSLYADREDFFDSEELRLLDELALDIAFALEGCERDRERQSALERLRSSEERFRELAENIREALWITDPAKDRMLYISPAYEKIWGRTCASLYAAPRSWLDAIHPEDRDRVLAAAKTKQTRGDYDETYRIVRLDGAVRWIRDRAFPVVGTAENVLRVVGTAEDVTERRHLEEQLRQSQKMEAFGQLAGGVAHDFNNILAAMMMQAELSGMDEGLPAEVRRGLQLVRASAERGANLTRQLLLFSHKQLMQPRDLDLNDVVTSLAKMLQRIIEENVRLQLELHPAPLLTHADAGMLDQVLMNLAVNARDAMRGGGRLHIETTAKVVDEDGALPHPDAAPGRYVCLCVRDNGTGIAPDVLPHIFEPFFTTKGLGKGTGLGLATVFGIVKQHHGWVHVESELGRGTSFQVFLPAISVAAAETARRAAPLQPRGGTETILVVEDESAVRLVTRAVLERVGYRVLEAGDGIEAQRIWAGHRDEIRLLLTDIVMPGGVNGRELAGRLQADNPALRVVFTSGYSADISGREFAFEEGQNFIQKPASPQHLLETVRRCLDA